MSYFAYFFDFFKEVASSLNVMLNMPILPGFSIGVIVFFILVLFLFTKLGDLFIW